MSAVVLDLVLLIVLVAYVASGYRRGLFVTLVSAAGFLGGCLAALVLLPEPLTHVIEEPYRMWRPVALLVLTLLAGALLQGFLIRLTWRMQRGLRRSRARPVDAILGALLTVVVAAATLWFVAGVLRLAAPGPVARTVASSQVLGAVDRLMPATTEQLLDRVVVALDAYGFPRVFGGAEPIEPADPADEAAAAAPGVAAAAPSVLRIDVLAPSCGRAQEGSGWVAAPGFVVTNAHVVSGGSRVTVTRGDVRHDAIVVAFDPDRDLAVLAVPDLDAAPLPLGEDLSTGDSAAVAGYPLGGAYRVDAARVRAVLSAHGEDIYGQDRVVRQVYALRVGIVPGNSGGPLLAQDGRVSGVVFARSLDDSETGYALTLDELRPVLAAARSGEQVSTGRCAA